MKCPVDGLELLLTSREGIELDYCPQCRGVWFDRGEIDKLIERSNRDVDAAPRYDDRRDRSDRDVYRPEKSKKKKASSFLSDLLEFG